MKNYTFSAPGKIHLIGERMVVFGKPALLGSISLRCRVKLNLNKSQLINIKLTDFNKSYTLDLEEVKQFTLNSNKKWQEYVQTGALKTLKSIILNDIDLILIAIGETLLFYKDQNASGFDLSISSDIPIGSGLGSSAALAVAIAGAVSSAIFNNQDIENINNIAYTIEQKIHGLPSGGDNSTVCYGGFIWYRKETPHLKLIKNLDLQIPRIQKNIYIINTGKPTETTGEMIALMMKFKKSHEKLFARVLDDQEKISKELLTAMLDDDQIMFKQLITEGEENLEKIQAVSEFTKDVIRHIEKAGGAAKISGAGGKQVYSGAILVYHDDITKLKKITKQFNLLPLKIDLGTEGFKKES